MCLTKICELKKRSQSADGGSRTRAASLEGSSATTTPHPHVVIQPTSISSLKKSVELNVTTSSNVEKHTNVCQNFDGGGGGNR
jgi:hypothetical protein